MGLYRTNVAGYAASRNGIEVFRRVQVRNPQLPSRIVAVTNAAAGVAVSHFDYAHDVLHRPVSRNSDTFSYNARGEVSSASVASNAAAYAYDPIGNRTQTSDTFGVRQYTHNALNEAQTVAGSLLSYDADGNLVSDWRFDYAWDAGNRLVAATPIWPSDGDFRVRNEYDHLSRRVAKHVDAWSDAANGWICDNL